MTPQPSPSRTPPATPVYTTVATPDGGFDATVTCRGGLYGDLTVVGFRVITERDPSRGIEAGVAVEIEKTRDGIDHGKIIAAVKGILSGGFIHVTDTVPQFVQVPNPQDTALYLTAQQTDQGEINILTEVKKLFERQHNHENSMPESQISDHVPYHGMRMPQIGPDLVFMQTGSCPIALASRFRTDLEQQNVFPGWRNFQWARLEACVLIPLREAGRGSSLAKNLELVADALTEERRQLPMSSHQREKVLFAYCAVAEAMVHPREVPETAK